jgi:GNAT superfamily N-acetyltransferase
LNANLQRDASGARRLFELVLREGGPIAPEFPLLFEEASAHPARAFATIEQDGEVRSACALLSRELVLPDLRLPIGLIGSVATHPDWRGRGFAARVLERAEEELASAGAALAILWADDKGFYERRGWRAFGSEHDFVIHADLAAALPAADGCRPRAAADDEALHELYLAHPERVGRTLDETRALLACPNMEVLVCERWQRVVAYACLGRGQDFANAIHEWGGDALSVLALVRAHVERRLARDETSDVVLIAPVSARDLTARLARLGVAAHRGVLGMAKILDARACAEIAAKRLDQRGGLKVEERPDGLVRLFDRHALVELSREELLELLFAASGDRTRSGSVASVFHLPTDRLPLEPFVWGLDSI